MLEPGRGQQADTGALPLENRVRGDRRAMQHQADVGRLYPGLFADQADTFRNADRLVLGR